MEGKRDRGCPRSGLDPRCDDRELAEIAIHRLKTRTWKIS